MADAPGYEGTALFPPDDAGRWLSVVRFRSDRRLADWLSSARRAESLPGLRSILAEDFSSLAQTTPFGITVRVDDGRLRMTPNWKSAMMVMLVLYPTVMLLSRFLGPVLDGWSVQPWLALWLSQVVSVVLMQWWRSTRSRWPCSHRSRGCSTGTTPDREAQVPSNTFCPRASTNLGPSRPNSRS